ncbi:uncharacterized protein JCM6883_003661 [Sporobolomyces salmoneus]|uniref:uncharacterized protein n=1 Tax=Sporobolomyces salmoneus TaxID=183962 RepID=UPI00317E1E4F
MAQMEKQARSSFVWKLHELLSAERHPEWLRWINDDTFGITSVEAQAKAALSPQWDFRSLASFIRQLSYYSFKRLSDRRRSAERRSHNPSLIVFTHESGNFVRSDISKTLNIPRKLRSRKKSAAGSRRKSSTASSIAFDYEYEPQERSPTPEPYYSTRAEEEVPTQTHVSLSNYQFQPWTAVQEPQAASSPRSLPISPPEDSPQRALYARETTAYDYLPAESSSISRNYPSPISAPPPPAYAYESPTSSYREVPTQAYQQPHYQQSSSSSNYYYPSTSYSQTPSTSNTTSSAYASNELPPIRTITSGLVGPMSPPAETYSHYPQQQIVAPQPIRRRSSHAFVTGDLEDSAITPLPSHLSAQAPPLANGLVAMHQVDSYYPPSPPRQHLVHPNHVSYYPTASSSSSYSCAGQASDYQQNLIARNGEVMYTTAAYH